MGAALKKLNLFGKKGSHDSIKWPSHPFINLPPSACEDAVQLMAIGGNGANGLILRSLLVTFKRN